MFRYQGNFRFQGIWDTPNHAAAALLLIVFAALAIGSIFAVGNERGERVRWAGWMRFGAIGLFWAVAACGAVLIAQTYSRGGYLALAVGLAVAALFAWRRCVSPLSIAGVFLVALAALPSAMERASEVISSGEDRSVGNRLVLWKGALAMSADYWSSGVGLDAFHEDYTAYYQPKGGTGRYRNAVSDYLTLSAAYGIAALAGYLWIGSLLVFACFLYWRRTGLRIFGYLVAGLAAFAVAGVFSHFLTKPKVLCFAIGMVVMVGMAIGWRRAALSFGQWRNAMLASLAFSIVACVVVLATGASLGRELGVVKAPGQALKESTGIDLIAMAPRHSEPIGLVVYLSDNADPMVAANMEQRHLAESGFLVALPKLTSWGKEGLDQAKRFAAGFRADQRYAGLPMYIVGHGQGGRLAIVAASKIPEVDGVVALGTKSSWIVPALSPEANLKTLKCPLLISHGRLDNEVPLSEASKLELAARRQGIPVRLIVLEDVRHFFGSRMSEVALEMKRFFEETAAGETL